MATQLELTALKNIPLIEPGDDLVAIITQSLEDSGLLLEDGDVLVLAQKVISKAEDRYAYLNDVKPSGHALALAKKTDKDARVVQLILNESNAVVRHRKGVIIVEHCLGYVHANAGIDQSNIQSDITNPRVLLLPKDPDASAAGLRAKLKQKVGVEAAIIINDSAGRAWREGTQGFAIATAGFKPLVDLIGHVDLFERPLEATKVAVADELAAAASFLMGQASEGAPVVLVRGAKLAPYHLGSNDLIRERSHDLFR